MFSNGKKNTPYSGTVLNVDRAIHPHDMFGSIEWLIVIEARQYAVSDLLNDQLLVRLSLFALPEDPVRMAFHVLHVTLSVVVLLVCKSNSETGLNFLCVHSL